MVSQPILEILVPKWSWGSLLSQNIYFAWCLDSFSRRKTGSDMSQALHRKIFCLIMNHRLILRRENECEHHVKYIFCESRDPQLHFGTEISKIGWEIIEIRHILKKIFFFCKSVFCEPRLLEGLTCEKENWPLQLSISVNPGTRWLTAPLRKSSFNFCKNLFFLLFWTSWHDQMDFGGVWRQKIIVIIIVTMYNRNPVPPGCFPKFPQQPTFFVTFFWWSLKESFKDLRNPCTT